MEAREKVSEWTRKGNGKFAETANKTLDQAEKVKDRVKDVRERMMETWGDYVRTYPWTSLGLAVGLGFLMSHLLSDRR